MKHEDIEASVSGLMPSELRTTTSKFADCICYSAKYCVSRDKGAGGPVVLLFPLWIAKDLHANEGDGDSRQREVFCIEMFQESLSRAILGNTLLVLTYNPSVHTRLRGIFE